MLWLWIARALRFVHALLSWELFRAEDSVPEPVDVNATCPGCGHNNGQIKCVARDGKKFIEHRCKQCGAGWFDKTILEEKDQNTIHPSEK